MPSIEESIEIKVPIDTAYNQWTQFEDFPQFMEGVTEVKQLDDTTLRWRAQIAGQDDEWESKITEQTPDQRIAWTSYGGPYNSGVVTFHKLDDSTTKVMIQMEYEPDNIKEKAADIAGVVKGRISGDLKRFKEFIEERGEATGAWRGEVPREGSA